MILSESRLKNDRVDSEALADLLRSDFVCEAYVPDKEHREFRQLTRARMDLVENRTRFKEKVSAILDKYELVAEHQEEGVDEYRTTFSHKWKMWILSQMSTFSWIDRMQHQHSKSSRPKAQSILRKNSSEKGDLKRQELQPEKRCLL